MERACPTPVVRLDGRCESASTLLRLRRRSNIQVIMDRGEVLQRQEIRQRHRGLPRTGAQGCGRRRGAGIGRHAYGDRGRGHAAEKCSAWATEMRHVRAGPSGRPRRERRMPLIWRGVDPPNSAARRTGQRTAGHRRESLGCCHTPPGKAPRRSRTGRGSPWSAL